MAGIQKNRIPAEKEEELHYHILEDEEMRTFLKFGGHASLDSIPYSLYVGWIVAFLLFMVTSGFRTIFVGYQQKILIMNVCQIVFLMIFCILAIGIRHIFDRKHQEALRTVKNGIFIYKDEPLNEEEVKIKREVVKKMKFFVHFFKKLLMCIVVQCSIFLSLLRWLFNKETTWVDEGMNPYLPYPFYMPFSTWDTFGFICGYILVVLAIGYNATVIMDSNGFYISFVLTIVSELRVLNHSLRSIKRRAQLMYNRRGRGSSSPAGSSTLQDCLHKCLISNLRHHKAILRFKKAGQTYAGIVLGMLISVVALILAVSMYLLQEDPERHTLFIFLTIFIAELVYTFYVCYCGQLVIEESKQLYSALYETPWPECRGDFTRVLRIMMTFCRRELVVSCIGLDVPASLQLYCDLISGMYKLVNVMRKS